MTDILDRLGRALADRYTIERELGAGGMATVYLAQDLRHDRKVAIKVLRPELAAVIGADRFLSEIKTTANLQHPHILPLFDSGAADSFLFYVMPYVEGESLRDRITREHQLPVADAVRLATEIAGALDYAHRQGVIHRDIKPENVMLHDGQALVADFGIALAMANTTGTRMTETGMSLGTPHYMSPEQAMGEREITGRSDVYALGAITYEMLVGEPPFTGPTAQAIIARVMTEEPRGLTIQRKSIPPAVEGAVRQALEKLPADRFATPAEFAAALKDPNATSYRTAATPVVAGTGRRGWLIGAVATAIALALGWAIGRSGRTNATASDGVIRAELSFGDSISADLATNIRMALSPDGKRVAFMGRRDGRASLFVRELSGGGATPIADTEDGYAPFFSPDGNQVAFFHGPTGGADLRVVSLSGGVPREIVTDSASGYGGSWADDGNIYYAATLGGVSRVPATGGTSMAMSKPDTALGVTEHDFPDVLPGSRLATVMLWKGSAASSTTGLLDLATGATTELTAGAFTRYLAPGFLVTGTSQGQVSVARFDPVTGALLSEPATVMQDVSRETQNGTVQFAVSRTGTLVFQQTIGGGDVLTWVDREGNEAPLESPLVGALRTPRLSPDGKRIAVAYAGQGSDDQIWVKDLVTGSMTKLSTDLSSADRPTWIPGESRVAYMGVEGNRREPFSRRADGSDAQRLVLPGGEQADEIEYDPTGRYLVLRTRGGAEGSRWLRIFEPGVDSAPRDLLPQRPFDQFAPAISPDGRWLAYGSSETGVHQVFVRPFPSVDSAKFAISIAGGGEPRWRRDGGELYFRGPRGEMFAVTTALSPTFTHSAPREMFAGVGLLTEGYHAGFDVHADGRFLMLKSSGGQSTSLSLVLNWRDELESLGTTQP